MRWSTLAVVALSLAGCGDGSGAGSPPVAVLVGPEYVDLGQRAVLDASGSSDPDGDIARFRFVVGDGSAAVEQPDPLLEHLFQLSGLIGAQVEVEDAEGHRARASLVISVRRP